ncbi:MAG: hypothetical protein M3162_08910, partial [Thermoproteota archaeon]|nr:hypothetical protein [Thermoproteota archaeon]
VYCAYSRTTIFLFSCFMLISAVPHVLYIDYEILDPVKEYQLTDKPSSASAGFLPVFAAFHGHNKSLHSDYSHMDASNVTAMLERGNVAMGFDQNKISHQFITTSNGGIIKITALDSKDNQTVDQIKNHVKEIQEEFREGNFTKPFFIHAQVVPGTDIMNLKRDLIEYRIEDIENGSSLILVANDVDLINAINQFFRFQSGEHRGH